MSLITMVPTINAFKLEKAINVQYDLNIDNINEVLCDDHYYNNKYFPFYLNEIEEYDERYMNPEEEEKIRLRNLIREYLKDILSDFEYVFVNIVL